mgnify:CR=1 FL=1
MISENGYQITFAIFMLGGAILVIVLVLIFCVRACVGGKKGNSNEDQKTAQK